MGSEIGMWGRAPPSERGTIQASLRGRKLGPYFPLSRFLGAVGRISTFCPYRNQYQKLKWAVESRWPRMSDPRRLTCFECCCFCLCGHGRFQSFLGESIYSHPFDGHGYLWWWPESRLIDTFLLFAFENKV